MIELRDVSVGFPDSPPILKNISMTVRPGEWVAVVGHNGSGKTTLLRTLAGLVKPIAGDRRLNGKSDPPRLALLVQEPDNLFVASSVMNELLLSPREDMDRRERQQRIERTVVEFRLQGLLDRNPHRLSGGEKQRLAMATVSLSDSDVLLLDEPTSYLDEEERMRCLDFVREVHRGGTSVVFAGPDLAAVGDADRVLWLDGGEIRYDGPRAEFTPPPPDRHKSPPILVRRTAAEVAPTDLVRLEAVGFGYDDRPVLGNVDLSARTGFCIGVSGRNGSGKSTLLAIISGIAEPTSGHVYRAFRRPVENGVQQVFHLFQSPERLFFAESVGEEIAFGLSALRLPVEQRTERVRRVLELTGLDPSIFVDRSPFTLSFGEMRRVAMAIVLALEPRLILLDEPTSCLDESGLALVRRLIGTLKEEGSAVVVASHDERPLAPVVDEWARLPG